MRRVAGALRVSVTDNLFSFSYASCFQAERKSPLLQHAATYSPPAVVVQHTKPAEHNIILFVNAPGGVAFFVKHTPRGVLNHRGAGNKAKKSPKGKKYPGALSLLLRSLKITHEIPGALPILVRVSMILLMVV